MIDLLEGYRTGLHIINRGAWIPAPLRDKMRSWTPQSNFGQMLHDTLTMLPYDTVPELIEKANEILDGIARLVIVESSLGVKIFRAIDSPFRFGNGIEDYGIVSRRVVTTTGVEQIVDTFQSTGNTMGSFFWHAIGLSSAAEAAADVGLTNEMTTAGYGSASRTSGTQTTGSAGPHVYETVGTVTIDSVTSGTPMVVQEHGIFKSSAVGATGLFDRSLTGTQTLSTGDSIQVTYDLTITAGG